MVKIGEIPNEIALGNGDSVILVFDASTADIGILTYEGGGTGYAIPVTVDGKKAIVKGGKRLMAAFSDLVSPTDGPTRIRLTAHGRERSFDRTYDAEKVV